MAEQSPDLALTTLERTELSELEGRVESGLKSFYETGTALRVIRDARLYRETHPTFEVYCEERWGFTDSRAKQLIRASQVALNVLPAGPGAGGTIVPPMNEAQARVLAPLSVKRQREVYETSVKTAPVRDGRPVLTAIHIRATLLSHNEVREQAGEVDHDFGRGKSSVEKLEEKLRTFDKERKLLFLLACAARLGHTQRAEVVGGVEAVKDRDVEARTRSLRVHLGLD
jgi:hypothetical protein